MSAPVRFTLRLTNPGTVARTVVLEPWTGEYRLGPGERLEVEVEGTPATPLEIEVTDDRIIAYAFDTSDAMLTAFRNGQELRSEHAR